MTDEDIEYYVTTINSTRNNFPPCIHKFLYLHAFAKWYLLFLVGNWGCYLQQYVTLRAVSQCLIKISRFQFDFLNFLIRAPFESACLSCITNFRFIVIIWNRVQTGSTTVFNVMNKAITLYLFKSQEMPSIDWFLWA